MGGLVHFAYWTPLIAYVAWALHRRHDRRILVALAPAFALLVSLIFILHSQNIAHRFEAPVDLALLFAAFALAAERATASWRTTALAAVAMAASTIPLAWSYSASLWSHLWGSDYLKCFPARISGLLSKRDTVALTEAGRLPFFNTARFLDLDGLNDAEAALHGADPARLARLRPDVLMFHRTGVLGLPPQTRPVRELACSRFAAALRPIPHDRRAIQAAFASAVFLSEQNEAYRCFAVKYEGGSNHLYAVRRSWTKGDAFVAILRDQQRECHASYFEARSLAANRSDIAGP